MREALDAFVTTGRGTVDNPFLQLVRYVPGKAIVRYNESDLCAHLIGAVFFISFAMLLIMLLVVWFYCFCWNA